MWKNSRSLVELSSAYILHLTPPLNKLFNNYESFFVKNTVRLAITYIQLKYIKYYNMRISQMTNELFWEKRVYACCTLRGHCLDPWLCYLSGC